MLPRLFLFPLIALLVACTSISVPGNTTTTATIYFPRLLADDSLGLSGTGRALPTGDVPRVALEALIQGPNGDERANDYEYPLSPRTRILAFRVENGTAQVDLSAEIDRVRGIPFSEIAYWSIVYTLTGTPGVNAVSLFQEGQPLKEFGHPAVAIASVAGRSDAPAFVRPR